MPPAWVWIAATVWAALAQTMRNAAQRHLTAELGTLGATLVRFLYGVPFASVWLLAVNRITGASATRSVRALRFLGRARRGESDRRHRAAPAHDAGAELCARCGVLEDRGPVGRDLRARLPGRSARCADDPRRGERHAGRAFALAGRQGAADRRFPTGWTSRTALLGVACGALFALSAVGYRGATLALPGTRS
jgi:hypothetical protein